MTDVGIHAHPTMKLGRRPHDPARPVLAARDFLTGRIPERPARVDHLVRAGLEFGLYANDRFGVCGPTALANSRRMVTAWLTGRMVAPSQDDVFDLYRRSGNPGFDPATGADDNGVQLAEMLSAAMHGGLGGVHPVAYAKVDVRDLDEVRAAVAVFGFLIPGVDLQAAQEAQTGAGVWDWVPSGEWGGHAILAGSYADEPGADRDRLGVITWEQVVECTTPFLEHQLAEAWVVVWPEHLTDRGFLEGVDLAALASAYTTLTGRPFPQHVPLPVPPPRPAPPAAPDPVALEEAVRGLVDDPLTRAFLATRPRRSADRAVHGHVEAIVRAAGP